VGEDFVWNLERFLNLSVQKSSSTGSEAPHQTDARVPLRASSRSWASVAEASLVPLGRLSSRPGRCGNKLGGSSLGSHLRESMG
jgi:hypothetical protein